MRVSYNLATHDKRPTPSRLRGYFRMRNFMQPYKRNKTHKSLGLFLEVSRAFENCNMSLFLALLLVSLKTAENPYVFLHREVSQNLKNCKQCSKIIYRIMKKELYK